MGFVRKAMTGITAAFLLGPGLLGGCRRHHAVPVLDEPAETAPHEDDDTPAAPAAAPAVPATAVTVAPAKAARKIDAGTANGDVAGPKAADLDQKLATVKPSLYKCLDLASNWPAGKTLPLTLSYSILPTGKTDNISIISTSAPLLPLAEQCMKGQLSQMEFPPFGGEGLVATFHLDYQRSAPAKP